MKTPSVITVKVAGFTLIEILIVLFIVSIVATVALLSMGRNDNKQAEAFANELTQLLTLAEEQAILQPAVLGFTIKDKQVIFSRYVPADVENKKRKKATWVPLSESVFNKLKVPPNVYTTLKIIEQRKNEEQKEDKKKNLNPPVIISTNGDITPFTLFIGKQGQKAAYAIIGEENGTIINKTLKE